VSGAGRGIDVLDGGGYRRGLGVTLGLPILTNGALLRSRVEMRAAIELSLGR